MRVTNQMISSRVLFNMQRTMSQMFNLQSRVSSGRQIEKPSDDPTGTIRDLNYRNEIIKNEQFSENINIATTRMENYDYVLAELKDIVTTAKGEAILMSDDHASAEQRNITAIAVKSLFEQVVKFGNDTLGGNQIFSGFKTDTVSFTSSTNGVVYNGDFGVTEFPIETSTKMNVSLNGSETFLKSISGNEDLADIDLGISNNTQLVDLHNGLGVDQAVGTFTITDNVLGITSTIDISADVSIADVINTINTQLTADGFTNVTAQLGPDGNNLALHIDESIPQLLNDNTALSDINDGYGLDLSDGRVVLTDGGGVYEEINFSTANTIGDIRTIFNNHMTAAGGSLANVSMQLNAAGNGLDIIDSNGVPLGLTTQEFSVDTTVATDLGILGSINPTLNGQDLRPQYNFTVAEIGGSTAEDLGLLDTFHNDFNGVNLDPQLTDTTLFSDFNNRLGLEMNEIVIWQGEASRTFDLSDPALVTVQDVLDLFNNSGLDITVSVNENNNGLKIENNDNTRSLTIEDADGGNLSKKLGMFGSTDMMGSMLVLIHSLENNDREGIELMEKNLDDAIENLLHSRSIVGAKAKRLNTTSARITEQNLNITKLLSEVEDADFAELITKLSMTENSYQASLLASSKIIQPSLLNFLK